MTRAERRREARGYGPCPICENYRKLKSLGICLSCERTRTREVKR